jgi:hypothetical protein
MMCLTTLRFGGGGGGVVVELPELPPHPVEATAIARTIRVREPASKLGGK